MREYPVTVVIGKYFIKGMKRQAIEWKKILASHKTEKGLKKKKDSPMGKWTRDLLRQFTK